MEERCSINPTVGQILAPGAKSRWYNKSLSLNPHHVIYHLSHRSKFSFVLSIFRAHLTSNSTSLDAPSQNQPTDVSKKGEMGVQIYCKHFGSGIGKEEKSYWDDYMIHLHSSHVTQEAVDVAGDYNSHRSVHYTSPILDDGVASC